MRYTALVLLICLLPFASFATAPITGSANVCEGSTTSLTDADAGGAWSSSNTAIADVNTIGVVTGFTVGTATITYNTGSGFATVTITVDPTPHMSSPLTATLCDSNTFNYIPISTTPGTTFDWSRPYVVGIYEVAGSGSDNPNEQLLNTTDLPVTVNYIYTLTAGSCKSIETVTLTVNPIARLSSSLDAGAVCSGSLFAYVPTSPTPGTTYAWTRTTVGGITPSGITGSGNISETLTNTTSGNIFVKYKFKTTAYGCTAKTDEIVTVSVHSLPCNLVGVAQTNVIESHIYPNPTNGTITAYIASPAKERVVITINNMVGERVKEITTDTNTATDIDLDVAPGMYTLMASSANTKYYIKLVVSGR